MAGSKNIVLVLVAGLTLGSSADAQTKGRAAPRHRVAMEEPAVSAAVAEAEAAIEKQDYAAAEHKLTQAVTSDPKDYRAWYDLGFVLNATERRAEAIDAYRKSVAAKPDVFESNLNLGLMLAATGQAEAEQYLRAATHLKPTAKPEEGLARAWLSLGRVLEPKEADRALEAYGKAAKLQTKDPEPHLSAGLLLERQDRLAEAENEYRQAVALDTKSTEAMAGLVNVYTRAKRLPEAETLLRTLLAHNPNNTAARLQLARVLMAQERSQDATAEYEAALKTAPDDADAPRELAAAYAALKRYAEAVALYRSLVQRSPNDAVLRHRLGVTLLRLRNFPQAEQELLAAVRLNPQLGAAYGDLALAAAENKNYELAIRALDARAQMLPENPGTYFLRATSYDHLKAFKQAAENYRQFLIASGGKDPDQEWKARHRLKAIDPRSEK
ncbi:MAG TPA: tetratricopeptide repeat protein [Terriglobales bacterium]|jgi:Flp pilus assembly protein TadD|nr:tetratricopeptide repeat protein [Terriglobales bacterium]